MKQISIQRCDMDGDNRLRVCYSACESYNTACGARLDCSDRTLFSGEGSNDKGMCTGDGAVAAWWMLHFSTLLLIVAFCLLLITFSLFAVVRQSSWHLNKLFFVSLGGTGGEGVMNRSDLLWSYGPYVVLTDEFLEGGSLYNLGTKRPTENADDVLMLQPPAQSIPFNMLKAARNPSRGFRDIFLDRMGQLSSRGSPRKGDYNVLLEGN